MARMAFADCYNPLEKVWKYFRDGWSQLGINGPVTPIFPVKVSWQDAHTDACWGPSVHWSWCLHGYVMLESDRPPSPRRESVVTTGTFLSMPGAFASMV